MNRIYLSLGSNLGDRRKNLEKAIHLLEERAGRIGARSALYETEPWGFKSDLPFFNQVIELYSGQAPLILLNTLHEIEKCCGRESNPIRFAPRTADLDILLFNNCIISTPELILPHPTLHLRRFVLIPMAEIAPNLAHPVFNRSIRQLLRWCKDPSAVNRLSP